MKVVGTVEDKEGAQRTIELARAKDGTISVSCPCMHWEETGLPCARAAKLLAVVGWCSHGFPKGCFRSFLLKDTWEEQARIPVPHLVAPSWLNEQAQQNPAKFVRSTPLTLLPGRIWGTAGRPKERTRRRKTINSHHNRWKAGFEPATRRRFRPSREGLEGDDEEIDLAMDDDDDIEEEEDIESSGEGISAEGNSEDDDDGEEEAPQKTLAPLEGEQSVAAVWAWGSGKRTSSSPSLCSCCGESDHKWPTCRKRNVEFMLVSLGIMKGVNEIDLIENEPNARNADSQMITREEIKQSEPKGRGGSKKVAARKTRMPPEPKPSKRSTKKSKTT